MPRPTSALSTLRPDLAGALMAYDLQADLGGFIGLRLMPVLEVAKQAGNFGSVSLAEILKERNTERAPGSAYNRGGWAFGADSYATLDRGFEEPVDDREAQMYADYFDAELMAAMRARDAVLRNQERRIAALANAISATQAVSGSVWSTAATGTPIADIKVAKKVFRDATGILPNMLVMSYDAWTDVRDCAEVLDRIKYAGFDDVKKAAMNPTAVAQALDVPEIAIAGAMRNSANEADAASLANVWDNTEAVLLRVPTSNDIREPAWGRTFHWGEDGSAIGGLVETYREEGSRSDIVRCRMDTHEKQLIAALGIRLTGVRAS